jgi:hypothetical protein
VCVGGVCRGVWVCGCGCARECVCGRSAGVLKGIEHKSSEPAFVIRRAVASRLFGCSLNIVITCATPRACAVYEYSTVEGQMQRADAIFFQQAIMSSCFLLLFCRRGEEKQKTTYESPTQHASQNWYGRGI